VLLWYVRTAFFAALRTLSLGLNSKQALSWFCFAHIKQQIVSLFRSDLISVCIFFNIEKILSVSALLTGITQQALANLDKTLKLSLFIKAKVLLVAVTAFLCKLVSECLLILYSPPEATLKLELHRVQNARSFPNELDCNQWCDFFHSSWNLQLYFFFFDVEEGVLGPEFHLLFVD
jgi:hypothetical protein